MPELQFDENGWPVWTGMDPAPDPVAEAVAAMNSLGQPGGIPYPGNMQTSPGAQPFGAPPAETRENALMDPDTGALEYPSPSAVDLAAPQPALGTGAPVRTFDPAQVLSGPSDAFVAARAVEPNHIEMEPMSMARPAMKPRRVDPLSAANAEADAAQTGAAQALYDHGVASNEAQRQLAERRAVSAEDHAKRQAEADAQFQTARAKAQQDSELETAKWMADLETKAKEEPNPKRWFANQSTASKALWLLSLAFGTKAAMTAPGVQNIGLAMIRDEMDKDMGEQKARLAREMEALRTRGGVLDKKAAQRMAFLRDDHNIRAGQLLALEKAALERANAPGSADDQAAMAQAHSWLAQQRMATAAQRAQLAFQSKESQLSRGHAAWMQKNAQTFQADQNAIAAAERAAKDALDRAFKFAEDQAKAAGAKAAKANGMSTIDPASSGVNVVVGGKARPLTIDTSNEHGQKRHEQVTKLTEAAQEVSAELQLIRDAIREGSFTQRILGGDTNLRSAVTRLGYSKAKENDPRGIVTNADFTAGIVSAMGMKYDTVTGRFSADTLSVIQGDDPQNSQADAIDRELAVVEARTNAKLNTYVPLEDRAGGKIVWRAENRNPQEAQVETEDQMTARMTARKKEDWLPRGNGPDEITTVDELKKAKEAAAAGATNALPHYQRGADGHSNETVVKQTESFRGRAPSVIEERAAGLQKQVGDDSRASLEIQMAADAAVKDSKAREERIRDALVVLSVHEGPPTRKQVEAVMVREGMKPATEDKDYVTEVMDAVEAVLPVRQYQKDRAGK